MLTWWEGVVDKQGYGAGEGVIVDTTYREIARIRAGHGHTVDLHELILTPQGTALVTCRPQIVPADLSSIGGPRNGTVFESIIQEIDVATGRSCLSGVALTTFPSPTATRLRAACATTCTSTRSTSCPTATS